jgi:D-sedoheptulose 7-phosphate isomerase
MAELKYYERYSEEVGKALSGLETTDARGERISDEVAFLRWCSMTRDVHGNQRAVYFAGNGASASMSSHMAADSSKNGGLRAFAFNDAALLTAVSNDAAFEQSFAIPLERFGQAGDMLITISSSGNSPNVLAVIRKARDMEIGVVTLSGMEPDNRSRGAGDVNLYVPARTYGIVECCHQILLHCWLDQYMGITEW